MFIVPVHKKDVINSLLCLEGAQGVSGSSIPVSVYDPGIETCQSCPLPCHPPLASHCLALSAALSLACIPVSKIQPHCPHKFVCICQIVCPNFWFGQYEYLSHQLSITHTFCHWLGHTPCVPQIMDNPWLSH